MNEPWKYQLRIYLDDAEARAARAGAMPEALLRVLRDHDATLVSQLDAFEAYVAQAERDGVAGFPLYRWTKATIEDPAMRAKHGASFALRIHDAEVYDKAQADALEADVRRLAEAGVVSRWTRHDTNPASNIPVPEAYRS